MIEIEKMYSKLLLSPRSGFYYNLFSYPTKISPETIGLYIATHTEPGQKVVDMFGGSGSTAIGAMLCSSPTDNMIKAATEMKLTPVWGNRDVDIYDISTFGTFATKVMSSRINAKEFKKYAEEFILKANEKLNWIYESRDEEGNIGKIRHIVWSDICTCPKCNTEDSYYNIFVSLDPVTFVKRGKCNNCEFEGSSEQFAKSKETYFDTITQTNEVRYVRKPVLIYGSCGKTKWKKLPSAEDLRLIEDIEKLDLSEIIKKELFLGDLYRSGYHYGIKYLHQFYTKRNFYVLTELWSLTEEYSDEIRDALRLLILSYNQSHATLMSRVVAKKNQKDFVVTGAQSGVLYISNLPLEKNILIGVERKIKSFFEAFKILEDTGGEVNVYNQSSETQLIANESVDYLFTDPPFGDFIPYSEINQLNELWLEKQTNKKNEAIISKSQGKTLEKYSDILLNIFMEAHRVLRKKGKITMVFHSSSKAIWNQILEIIKSSDFNIEASTLLLKNQTSFIQNSSNGGTKGDSLILINKMAVKKNNSIKNLSVEQFIQKELSEKVFDEKIIYSKYVSECIKRNVMIDFDAREFYQLVKDMIR